MQLHQGGFLHYRARMDDRADCLMESGKKDRAGAFFIYFAIAEENFCGKEQKGARKFG
ncbi:MAG: hypothetical protein ACLTWO_12675 [Blautia massiliensis (ex Durand et al. 2017)]